MKDLLEQIQNNNVRTLGLRRKARKGSKLARHTLKEAMGEKQHYYGEESGYEDFEKNLYEMDRNPLSSFE